MIRRPPRSTPLYSSAASDVYKRQPRASGTLASHYAPKAPVRLMDAQTLQAELNLPGPGLSNSSAGVEPLIAIYSRTRLKTGSAKVLLKRMPEDAVAAAQELFSVLRGFDD